MHTPTPPLLLLLSTLALATTATELLTPESPSAGPPPPPPSPQYLPPQDLAETYEPNYLTRFVANKLSTPRKWMSEKPQAPTAQPPLSPATPSVGPTPPLNNGPAYTDPVKLQRFVQDLRANRRPNQLRFRRRGIKSKSESLPPPQLEAAEEVAEPKELTEAEFNAMFEEYRLKHDVAVGLPPKGQRQKKWEGTRCKGYVEAIMGPPGRGGG